MTNKVLQSLQQLYQLERERLLDYSNQNVLAGEYAAPVFGAGRTEPKLVLIGEAPGAAETKYGMPFVGKAGQQLNTLLEQAGLEREEIYITNAVKYRPMFVTNGRKRNRTPSKAEIAEGLPLLRQELLLLCAPIVVTLGNTPLHAIGRLCGAEIDVIGKVHGSCIPLSMEGLKFSLFPMYHPASTIYNRSLLPACEADAKTLGDVVQQAVNKI